MEKKKDNCSSVYRPDVEAFTKLWSNLRTFYEGTNVTKTIARLLNIYQSEDGLFIYEKLLRTLHTMLKDFDPKGFCTLASMVSPPKGVSMAIVEKTFYDATGHYRLNVPVLRFNNNRSHSNISTSQNHVKKQVIATASSTVTTSSKRNTDESNLPLKKRKILFINENPVNSAPVKQINEKTTVTANPVVVSSSIATLQPVVNYSLKTYPVNVLASNATSTHIKSETEVDNNSRISFSTKQSLNIAETNKSDDMNKKLLLQETLKLREKKVETNYSNDVKLTSDEHNAEKKKITDEDMKFFNISTCQATDEYDKKLQKAIQMDIYKMDHVQSDCKESALPEAVDVPFEMQEDLKLSLKNFLCRIKGDDNYDKPDDLEDKSIESYDLTSENIIKRDRKAITAASTKDTISSHNECSSNKKSTSNTSQTKFIRLRQSKSMKQKKPNPPTRPRSERVAQRNLLSQSASLEPISKSLNKKSRSTQHKSSSSVSSDSNLENNNTDLEVATVNCSPTKYPIREMHTISNSRYSMTNVHDFHPYYSNYVNQQHHMVHQQFIMDPYYPYNWRFQYYGGCNVPPPAHYMCCSMNTMNHKYSVVDGYFQAMNSLRESPNTAFPKLKRLKRPEETITKSSD